MILSKPTIFCDIDGTLIKHCPLSESIKPDHKLELLPGTIEKINEWESKGYRIILTTGRKECSRKILEKQLFEVGIFYDQLVMNIGGGARYLINDDKPDGENASFAICIKRNEGISGVEIL
jgi:histidinol phosphatase-like enzyme